MSSERKSIRHDIVARLKGKTLANNRVYASRSIPLPEELLPAILVTTKRERSEARSAGGGEPSFESTLTVLIEPVVKETQNAEHDDKLDDLAAQIEDVLLTDTDWVQQFEKIAYVESEIHYYEKGEINIASLEIQFDLVFSLRYQPVVVDDFATLQLNVDAIDPADPNQHEADATWPDGYGGQPGPDQRQEVSATIKMEIAP